MSISTFVNAIKECESANGAGKKKVIQEALKKLSPEGRALVFYAMNPYFTYGVKKFTRPKEYSSEDAPLSTVIDVLDQLRQRELTGDAARETVTMLLSAFTKETAFYLERVIEKDLKAGFSADTYNKIWHYDLQKGTDSGFDNRPDLPETLRNVVYQVPTFDVMLADKCEDAEEFEKYVTFPCQADWKYDGERNISMNARGSIQHISRSGIEAFHMNGLFDRELNDIKEYVKDKWGWNNGFVLDSERFANDWNDTVNAKKSDNDEAKSRIFLRAFFIMPIEDWERQQTSITMEQNRENLRQMLADLPHIKRITLTGGRIVKDYQDMTAYCDEVTTPGFDGQEKGHEGLILKDLQATYAWDRTMAWCKVKKFYTADGIIASIQPGRPKSKYEKTIGRLNCIGYLEDGTKFECGVGSGLKDWERDDIRDNPEKYLNGAMTIEIKYQEISKVKGRDTVSLRFPTVHRFRGRDDKIVNID